MVVGGGPVHIVRVLPHGGTSGVAVWGRDMGDDGINITKTRRRTCGIPVAGNGEEVTNSRGRFLSEGGGGQSASGGGDTTSQYLH